MKAEDIRALADDELVARINEMEEERFRLRFRGATEALEDPLRQRGIRRDVARLQTIMRERALGLTRESAPVKKPAAKRAAKTTKGAKKSATSGKTPRRSQAR